MGWQLPINNTIDRYIDDVELELSVSFPQFQITQELCNPYKVEYLRATFYQVLTFSHESFCYFFFISMGSKIFDFFGLFYLSGSYFLQNFLFSKLSYSTAESLFTKQMMVGYILTRISNQMKQIKLFRWLGTSFGSQKKNHLCLYVWMSGGSCILMQRAEPSISLKRFLNNSKLDSAQFNMFSSFELFQLIEVQ